MIAATVLFPLVFLMLLLLLGVIILYIRLNKSKQTKEKEQSFETLFEQQPEAWIIIDGISLQAIEANQKALNLFGLYRKNFVHELQFHLLFRDPLEDEEVTLLLNAVDNNTFVNKTLECRSLQGRVFTTSVSISRIYQGNLFCRFAELTENITISNQKVLPNNVEGIPHLEYHATTEESSSGSSNYSTSVIDPIPSGLIPMVTDAVAVIDFNQRFIEVSEAFASLTGYDVNELKELGFETIVHTSEAYQHEQWFRVLAEGTYRVARTERRVLRKDRNQVTLELLAASLPSRKAVVITAVDNSAARKEQEALKLSRENLYALIQNTDEAIFSVDSLDRLTVINHRFQQLISARLGRELNLGEEFGSALPIDAQQQWKDRLQKVLRGQTINYREESKGIEGDEVHEIFLYPVINDQQLVIGVSCYSRNITNRINQEKELLIAKEKAEQATLAKSEFLAVMSHEIRTPLNGLLGISELLDNTNLNPQQKEFVDIIRLSGESLLQVISDILDFSKIEADRMQLEESPFELNGVVEETFTILSGKALEKKLKLEFVHDDLLPKVVIGDKARLRQILMNLVGNALKFTEHGSINVFIKTIEVSGENLELQFEVKDTGKGISSKQIENLFDAFTQADSSTYRKYGGTGLGLTICRTLVNLMGGKIWVESEVGVGSSFFFTIKVKKSEKLTIEKPVISKVLLPAEKIAEQFPANILLAEDNDINRLLASKLFGRLGYSITTVEDGVKALNSVIRNRYDVVFMDVQMPEMDGLEATREIRKQLPENQQPIIIAMTAFAAPEDKDMCLKAGMNDYVTKPITLQDLESMLLKWVGKENELLDDMKNKQTEMIVHADVLLDQEAINRLMDIGKQTDPGFLLQVLDMFIAQAPQSIKEIEEGLEQGNYSKMWQAAHKLKGTSLNIGAKKLGITCREIENKGRNLELQGLKELVAKLSSDYELTVKELRGLFQYN